MTDLVIIADAKQVSLRTTASLITATLHAAAAGAGACDKNEAPIVTMSAVRKVVNRTRKDALIRNNKAVSGMVCFQFDSKICCNILITHNNNGVTGSVNMTHKI